MAFILDKQELKPGLVIFRRSDVKHRNWYCRLKVPNADRYKTYCLKTADINVAKDKAFDHDSELRFKVKHAMPIFQKSFSQVAKEYSDFQKQRATAGEITMKRWQTEDGYIRTQLNPYIGNMQITLIGAEKWKAYPLWRRSSGKGRGADKRVSDWTIRAEMAVFRSVMLFAARKKYTSENAAIFNMRNLKLGKPRGEAFTPEEYRALYTHARAWVKKAENKKARWYRQMFQKFMLFMTNTGLRPPEARNLRWRDVGEPRTGKDGRPFVPIGVRGKGKHRILVAPITVATYLGDIKEISKATAPDDFVFTTYDGKPAETLYASLLDDILSENETHLLYGASRKRRSTYSFRHTYATFRLMHGTDVYILAQQMGTSVEMIEDYYGHIEAVRNPDLILKGVPGWEATDDSSGEKASGVNADADGAKAKPRKGKDLPKAGKASRSTRRP
jgi:integrase